MRSRACSPPPVARPARISLRQGGLHGPHNRAFPRPVSAAAACAVDATGGLDPARTTDCSVHLWPSWGGVCRREARMFSNLVSARRNYEECPRGG
jgi:hypothetical protein